MTEQKKSTEKVGAMVKAKSVVRPDGRPLTVTDGLYVLDVPGVHVIDGVEVEAK